jgi:hypothetical protein
MNEASILKQLELIDKKMSESSENANQHLGKFLFGGLIAVIALLNTDLIIIKDYKNDLQKLIGSLIVGVVALILAHNYFTMVIKQYNEHRRSHRKLKYKYELTLHCMLSSGSDEDYQRYLEMGIDSGQGKDKLLFPAQNKFTDVAEYLRDHHGRKLSEIKEKPNLFYIAMDIVFLTLAVKILSIASVYFLKLYVT